jgi:hypothetical protein
LNAYTKSTACRYKSAQNRVCQLHFQLHINCIFYIANVVQRLLEVDSGHWAPTEAKPNFQQQRPGPSWPEELMEEAREGSLAAGVAIATAAAGIGRQQEELGLTITTEQHEDGTLLKLTCKQPVLQLKPPAIILENLGQ